MVVDRPKGSYHPCYSAMIYPLDYGYLPFTVGSDGDAVDVFIGEKETGIVGALFTRDAIKGDEEMKLLINMSTEEIQKVHAFMQSTGMTTTLVVRPF
jgi:inorganic pyrophosphatase